MPRRLRVPAKPRPSFTWHRVRQLSRVELPPSIIRGHTYLHLQVNVSAALTTSEYSSSIDTFWEIVQGCLAWATMRW